MLKLDQFVDQLDSLLDKFSIEMESIPSTITLAELEEKGNIVLAMNGMKDLFKAGSKLCNRELDKAEEHLCTVMVNHELLPYRHPKATLSPSVTGFFTVKNGKEFLDYLIKQNEEEPYDLFAKLVNSKKALKIYCEALLGSGKNIPTCISKHITAKVNIRRKKQ